ncbi:hypothetical protein MVEN_00865100 [Mycena venus]|uniref:Uncharacterized protein n=1 Tax=Mycena venus TaxID=2733690 RepID=A0A8H7D3L8_9AGAR|nr:hypothetical protein MVEN_00865100 [Mycena venus]
MPVYIVITPALGTATDNIYYVKFGDTKDVKGERIADYDTYNPLTNRDTVENANANSTINGTKIKENVLQRKSDSWLVKQHGQHSKAFNEEKNSQENGTEFFRFRPHDDGIPKLKDLVAKFRTLRLDLQSLLTIAECFPETSVTP